LIESFKATLEEVNEADLLIHVVDLSHSRVDEQMAAVDSVIKELDAFGKQTLIVFNKIDLLENSDLASIYCRRFPGSVAISAKTGRGIDQFFDALQTALGAWRLRSHFRIPLSESNLIAELHRVGHVLEVQYQDENALITAHVPPHLEQRLTEFVAR
jgi:GTP-binding protein HflX